MERQRRPHARRTVAFVAAAVVFAGGEASTKSPSPVPLDLSRGVLSQSNCKTPIGCGHPSVAVHKGFFSSVETASSLPQHILTLTLKGPFDTGRAERSPHILLLDFNLRNPSGHANNLICVSAVEDGPVTRSCARGVDRSGQLSVQLSSSSPKAIAIHFGLMPASGRHAFEVANARIVPGRLHKQEHQGAKSAPVDLAAGTLRQAGCPTPIGCAHPKVELTSTTFSSLVGLQERGQGQGGGGSPARLTLELSVSDVGRAQRRLQFAYRIDSANGQPAGRIRARAIVGPDVLEGVVEKIGSGEAALVIPAGSPRVDNVAIAFEPLATSPSRFEVSGVSYGRSHAMSGLELAVETGAVCETCDPPASRLDPCGPDLHTFYVEAAGERLGRGVRCVSAQLRAWYGEGWWDDPDWGRYRHLGSVTDFNLGIPTDGLAVEFGVARLVPTDAGETLVEYGTGGLQRLQMEVLDAVRLRVSTTSGSWNEIWQFVPKGDLLPAFFAPLAWDGACGTFGLVGWQVRAFTIHIGQLRCGIPADLDLSPDTAHVALPLVWYGEGYLEQGGVGDSTRNHLAWQVQPPDPPSPTAWYSAADQCVLEHEAGCRATELISVEVVGPEAPTPADPNYPQWAYWWQDFRDRQALYVHGPNSWNGGGDFVNWGTWWNRITALAPGAALPAPTGICQPELGEDCS